MNNPQNPRRARTRNNNKRSKRSGGGSRMDIKVRGNPKQLLDKYKTLARDALQAGERIDAENYLQHADHYQRVLNERNGLSSGLFGEEDEDYEGEEAAQRPSRRRRRESHEASENRHQGNGAVEPETSEEQTAESQPVQAPLEGASDEEPRRPRRRPRRTARTSDETSDETGPEDPPKSELSGEEATPL